MRLQPVNPNVATSIHGKEPLCFAPKEVELELNQGLRAQLERLPKDEFAPSLLTRSLFNIGLQEIVRALIFQDEIAPLLVCNKVRTIYEQNNNLSEIEKLKLLLTETIPIVDHVLENKEGFSQEVVSATRLCRSKREVRKNAEGMLFHWGKTGVLNALCYGYTWASDYTRGFLAPPEPVIPISDLTIATFEINNSYQVDLHGEFMENIFPAFVFNSQIMRVLFSFNLAQDKEREYNINANHVYLIPKENGTVGVYLPSIGEVKIGQGAGLEVIGKKIGIMYFDSRMGNLCVETSSFPELEAMACP